MAKFILARDIGGVKIKLLLNT